MDRSCYWVYILYCENDSYYTGYTVDLEKRYLAHLNGTGKCKYTQSFKPQYLAQSWQVNGSRALAMQLERRIKNMTRAEKEQLIADPQRLKDRERNDVHLYARTGSYVAPDPKSPKIRNSFDDNT